ncbi:MAG: hypothetical protein KatS3mg059_0929 [Thermomicrobiales bacterium]|nr:MAG: hypothetical protein KatS3mg059_0929 [Thermomicrobiales bacterium]
MALMGETIDVNVADLLSVLARKRHTGRLAITADGDTVSLSLDHGQLISVSSSNHELRLGQTLIRMGLLTPAQLDAAMHEQEQSGHAQPLGQIALDRGWITPRELARAAEEQCIEALARIIVARHGTFIFSREADPPAAGGLVTLNTDGIVLEATRRADEMMTLRSLLPPPGARLSLAQPVPGTGEGLSALEHAVLAALHEAPATLEELQQRLGTEEVPLWRAAVILRERGYIAVRNPSGQGTSALGTGERIPERTVEEILALGREGASGVPVPPVPTLADIRRGVPASAQTLAAITLVTREVVTAFNAGLPLRALAHFTDDHFRRQGPLTDEEIAALRMPAVPLPPEEQETIVAIREVRVLPDGRVSAILVSHYPAAGQMRKVLIFAKVDDRWRIDAVIEAPAATGILSAPVPT